MSRTHHCPTFDTVNWREFACGWGAACINLTTTYPVNKIIFRQILHGVGMQSAFRQMRSEGIWYLYRGILPPLCQKSLTLSIMFGVYEEVRMPLLTTWGLNKYVANSTGAMVAGTVEAVLTPFERIQTLLADTKYHDKFRNTKHAFCTVYRQYGYRELYRGLVPILLRNGPSNVGFFLIKDEVHTRFQYDSRNRVESTVLEFLCGAFIGVFLSSLFYPLTVVKIAMQSQLGGDFNRPIVAVFREIYRKRGSSIIHIYHGCFTNCVRSFISWGVINTAYENLKTIIYQY